MMSSDHVFGAYSLSPNEAGDAYTLKTAHLDRDSGEMIYSECYIDGEEMNPISGAESMQLSVRGEEFDVNRGEYKEAFDRAVNSEEAMQFEADHGINREVYATMAVMEDHFHMENSPEVVGALEARRDGLEAADNERGDEIMEHREALCQPPKDYEDKVVATIITKDSIHVLTEDGHMFEASELALEGKEVNGIKERSDMIHQYKSDLQAKGGVADFNAIDAGRNITGAAMELQTDPEKAGGKYDTRKHVRDADELLTHDLDISVKFGDDARG
ncbi:MAG: hypothetical protein OSB62_01050 [Alphaproteobacteria bacterium]|nr:hypothetical protein [Alphaproteobacteria bacterium]